MKKFLLGCIASGLLATSVFAADGISKKEAEKFVKSVDGVLKYEINDIKVKGAKGTIYFTAILKDMGNSPLSCTLGITKFEGKWNTGGLNCSNH